MALIANELDFTIGPIFENHTYENDCIKINGEFDDFCERQRMLKSGFYCFSSYATPNRKTRPESLKCM
jgi:hypothetical protein